MKNYVIIGGASGIGKGIAEKLLAKGNRVITVSRRESSETGGAEHISADIMSGGDFELPAEIHGLAYAPGSINLKPFQRLKDEDFTADLEINLLGAVRAIRKALPALKKAGDASILLFSTVAVQTGMPFHASVASAKGAVEGLTRALAAELAPKIRVNAIAPSITDTPLASGILSNEKRREASAQNHPLKRVGEVEDIASTAEWLLTGAGWVTGQIIKVDGGLSALR